jgi:hypothetical protein
MLFIVIINSKQMNKGRKIVEKIYKVMFYCMAGLKLYENQYDLIS